jgi:cytochrome c heme-lyase
LHAYFKPADGVDQELAKSIPHGDVVPGIAIPSSGRGNSADGSSWLNPTASQLFRSSRRKDKDISAEDALAVSLVHSAVVDETWTKVMEYESLHSDECKQPTLDKFEGKYGILSFKSRIVKLLYGIEPFDRHDWVVDRCGKKVTYIIDYYSDDGPHGGIEYMVDTRPAPTLGGLWDRARIAYASWKKGESWW